MAAVVFTDRTSFNAELNPGFYFEDFESVTSGPQASAIARSSGGFDYEVDATGNITAKLFVSDGSHPESKWVSTWLNTDSIRINPSSGNVRGIGADFFITDVDGNLLAGSFTVSVNDGSSQLVTLSNPGDKGFVGFVSDDPITQLSVTRPAEAGATFITIDNVTVGAVPEPATTAVAVGLALAGYVGIARRRASHRKLLEA